MNERKTKIKISLTIIDILDELA